MSIASEITRLQGVKSDILAAIADKGVTVPADSALDDCPGLIGDIEQGGGGLVLPELTEVQIGNQVWSGENVNVPMLSSCITFNSTSSYWLPKQSQSYNIHNAIRISYMYNNGWRVPKLNEIEALKTYLNGDYASIRSTEGWNGTQGTNTTGMNLIPYGCVDANCSNLQVFTEQAYMQIDHWGSSSSRYANVSTSNFSTTSDDDVTLPKTVRFIKAQGEVLNGKFYRTVQIGNRVWLAENYRDESGCFMEHPTYPEFGYYYKYGKRADIVIPQGWRIPAYSDFIDLQTACGGQYEFYKLKSIYGGWNINVGQHPDTFGFCALPAGSVSPGAGFSNVFNRFETMYQGGAIYMSYSDNKFSNTTTSDDNTTYWPIRLCRDVS